MLQNILRTLNNPRLDILILCKSNTFSNLIDNMLEYFKTKHLMCEVATTFKNINYIYFNDFKDNILLDLIEKSHLVICINCEYEHDIFFKINKLVFNNHSLICNNIASTYLSKEVLERKYNIIEDLDFIYNSIIIKLFKQNYKIVAAISHMDEKTIDLCLESIRNQSIPIEEIKVFQGLTPMCNSFNACLDYACDENADILLHTASDVIFEPWALKELLRIYNPKIHANVLSFGEDIILKRVNKSIYERAVCGIWIFNMDFFKDQQWRFQDEMKQDMKLFDKIKNNTGLIVGDNLNYYLNNGLDENLVPIFDIKYEQQNQGIHHPIWTLRETFDKFYYCLGKWKPAFKNELLTICKEFLKVNPENNCLITIEYILSNIENNDLKSKDSNELERHFNEIIKNIPINKDINNNFFVYHEKFINICNNIYDCKINLKPYDSLYNSKNLYYSITKSYYNFSDAPFYWKYTDLNSNKRVLNSRFINHKYLDYINFLLTNKYFFIQTQNTTNYLINDTKIESLAVIIINRINRKIVNDIYSLLLIYLYDINYILQNNPDSNKNKRMQYIKYILDNYTNDESFDYNIIKLSINKYYQQILDISKINFNTLDSHANISNNSIVKSSLLINNQYVTEISQKQNHFFLFKKELREIKIEKKSFVESNRNILFKINDICIYFDKEKLYTDTEISNNHFHDIHFLNTKDHYIFYFNLTTQIYMFLTNIQNNIQYLGDNKNKICLSIM